MPSGYQYFQKAALVEEALKVLDRYGVVKLIPDDFGPTVFLPATYLPDWFDSDENPIALFRKFKQVGDRNWLQRALRSVDNAYEQLQITELDFDPDEMEIQWEPIPLDRSDGTLDRAIEAVGNVIEAIEQDNGYAANAGGEREYVLSNLKAFQRAVSEQAEIYWMQIKTFALTPLGKVITRFGSAAVGIAATAARDLILEWLKIAFSKALDWL